MRLYGGMSTSVAVTEDDYKYEFLGDYKYLPASFIHETWNRAEEYQTMYEGSFRKNQSLQQQLQKQKEEIKELKRLLAIAESEIAHKNIENQKLQRDVENYMESNINLEKEKEEQKAKKVLINIKFFEQGQKMNALEKDFANLQKEFKSFTNDKNALKIKTELLEQREIKSTRILIKKDKEIEELKTINKELQGLLEDKKKQVKFEHGRAEGAINNMIRYRRKLYEMYDRDVDVLGLLQQLEADVMRSKNKSVTCLRRNNSVVETMNKLLGTFGDAPLLLNGNPPKCF